MDTVWQDVRYTMRTMARARGATIVALLTLAIGIGAVAAIYNVIDTVAVRPLPFAQGDRLVVLHDTYTPPPPGQPKLALNIADWRAMRGTFRGLVAIFPGGVNLSSARGARRISAVQTTPGLIRLLGGRPLVGRAFGSEDGTPGHDHVAIVSEALWRQQFGGAPDVVGRTIRLNNQPFVVVGVMPEAIAFPAQSDVWIPYALPHDYRAALFAGRMMVLARLRDGVSIEQAQAAVTHAEQQWAAAHPPPFELNKVTLESLRALLVGDAQTKFAILIGAAALMLLLACANVGGLLLARAEARQHEFAVRTAIGATPARLIRQLLVEGLILAIGGIGGGVILARALQPLLTALVPAGLAGLVPAGLGGRAFVVTMIAGVASALLFCLAPALILARADVHAVLKSSGPRRASKAGSLWQRLLIGQIGVTVVILVAAGLLVKSFWLLQRVDPGFDPHNVLAVNVALPSATYPSSGAVARYFRDALARIEQVSGVTAAGVVNALPLSGQTFDVTYTVVGQAPPANQSMAEYLVASPGYFAALRLPVLAGRTFTQADVTSHAPVMVIDARLARRIDSVRDAVGKTIQLPRGHTYQIIGVVQTVRDRALDGSKAPPSQFYLPMALDPASAMTLVIRGPSDDARFVRAIREAITGLDPSIPPYAIRTMTQVVRRSVAPVRTVTGLLAVGGLFGLILAIVGIYGVVAANVARRTQELGVRMALGATGLRVGGLVVRHALRVAAWGVGLGLLGAWAATRALTHVLYQVRLSDPGVYLVAIVCVGAATIAAAVLPALRASTIDPIATLRGE